MDPEPDTHPMTEIMFELKEEFLPYIFERKKTTITGVNTQRGPAPSKSYVLIDFKSDEAQNQNADYPHEPRNENPIPRESENEISIAKKSNYLIENQPEVMNKSNRNVRESQTPRQESRRSQQFIDPNPVPSNKQISSRRDNEIQETFLNKDPNPRVSHKLLKSAHETSTRNVQSKRENDILNDNERQTYLEAKKKSQLEAIPQIEEITDGFANLHKEFQDHNQTGYEAFTKNNSNQLVYTKSISLIKEKPFYHELCKRDDEPIRSPKNTSRSRSLKRSTSTPKIRQTYFDKYPEFYVKQYQKLVRIKSRPRHLCGKKSDGTDRDSIGLEAKGTFIEKGVDACVYCNQIVQQNVNKV